VRRPAPSRRCRCRIAIRSARSRFESACASSAARLLDQRLLCASCASSCASSPRASSWPRGPARRRRRGPRRADARGVGADAQLVARGDAAAALTLRASVCSVGVVTLTLSAERRRRRRCVAAWRRRLVGERPGAAAEDERADRIGGEGAAMVEGALERRRTVRKRMHGWKSPSVPCCEARGPMPAWPPPRALKTAICVDQAVALVPASSSWAWKWLRSASSRSR
jgi:hypothetical protein